VLLNFKLCSLGLEPIPTAVKSRLFLTSFCYDSTTVWSQLSCAWAHSFWRASVVRAALSTQTTLASYALLHCVSKDINIIILFPPYLRSRRWPRSE